jgi:hypothetical protein
VSVWRRRRRPGRRGRSLLRGAPPRARMALQSASPPRTDRLAACPLHAARCMPAASMVSAPYRRLHFRSRTSSAAWCLFCIRLIFFLLRVVLKNICSMLSLACCLLRVVCCMLQVAGCLSDVVCCMLSLASCLLHAVRCTLSAARCPLHVFRCTLSRYVVCCVWSASRGQQCVVRCTLSVARCARAQDSAQPSGMAPLSRFSVPHSLRERCIRCTSGPIRPVFVCLFVSVFSVSRRNVWRL